MLILRAKYLLTEPDNVVENGAVLVDGKKIVFAGCFKDVNKNTLCKIINLGNSAIAPGLINAHTHLELTSLHNRINYNGNFTDWIRQIINARKTWTERDYVLSINEGVSKSIESGTTTVADSTRNSYTCEESSKSNLRKIVFYELIDFNPHTAEKTIDNFNKYINDTNNDSTLSLGIFPHSPYTVSKELYKRCGTLSDELNILAATHISETNDEIEFLTKGTGNFKALLNNHNMLNNWKHPGLRPVAYLNSMDILSDNWLLIHCNYTSEDEIEYIKKSNANIVFCPRSHRYFRHKNHPFHSFLEHGINVALGTDSLASNDSLSILDEMKFIYENHNDLKPQDILYMGTIAGAIALKLSNKIGRLEPGFEADITAIKLPEGDANNIYDSIFSQKSECIFTMVSGSVYYDKNKLASSYR